MAVVGQTTGEENPLDQSLTLGIAIITSALSTFSVIIYIYIFLNLKALL